MHDDESNASDEMIDSDDEDEDDEPAAPAQSYMSLMKSLSDSAPHKAKRRKLDHSTTEEKPQIAAPAKDEQGSDSEEDEDEEAKDIDMVDEQEETAGEVDVDELFDDEDEDELDGSDPFDQHFDSPDSEAVSRKIKAIQQNKWRIERQVANGTRIQLNTPDVGESESRLPQPVSGIADLKLKQKLRESLSDKRAKFDAVEQAIAPLLFNYHDMLYCNRTVAGAKSVRRMACLHALNHIFKYVL